MRRRTILLGGLATAAATTAGAGLFGPRALPPARVHAPGGVALGGTDPVAYFTHARPVAGDGAFVHDWAGAEWRFVDATHRDAFAADPDAYAPRYGGFCAWAVAAKGALFTTRPENWSIEGGRLYLNYDDAVQATWSEDPAGFIAEADRRWPEIVARA